MAWDSHLSGGASDGPVYSTEQSSCRKSDTCTAAVQCENAYGWSTSIAGQKPFHRIYTDTAVLLCEKVHASWAWKAERMICHNNYKCRACGLCAFSSGLLASCFAQTLFHSTCRRTVYRQYAFVGAPLGLLTGQICDHRNCTETVYHLCVCGGDFGEWKNAQISCYSIGKQTFSLSW